MATEMEQRSLDDYTEHWSRMTDVANSYAGGGVLASEPAFTELVTELHGLARTCAENIGLANGAIGPDDVAAEATWETICELDALEEPVTDIAALAIAIISDKTAGAIHHDSSSRTSPFDTIRSTDVFEGSNAKTTETEDPAGAATIRALADEILGPEQREAFRLVDELDYDLKTAAKLSGDIPESTIRSRTRRARVRMADAIQERKTTYIV